MRLAAYEPDIPQNLGAMIRLGACFDVPIDVIEPCGFPFSAKSLRRAAMDYAEHADIAQHDSWDAYVTNREQTSRLVLLTTKSSQNLWNFKFLPTDTLLLGRESAGVPDVVHDAVDAAIRIPIRDALRSLNVAMAAAIALAEALRQTGDGR